MSGCRSSCPPTRSTIASRRRSTPSGTRSATLDGGLEIVVVDDGSADGTADAARARRRRSGARPRPQPGKGAAVRAGVLAATGRTVAFTDADLPTRRRSCARCSTTSSPAGTSWSAAARTPTRRPSCVARRARVGGRVINWLTRPVLRGQYRDTQCGLKAFRSDAAKLIFDRARDRRLRVRRRAVRHRRAQRPRARPRYR